MPVDPALMILLIKKPEWKHHLWIVVSLTSVCGGIVGYVLGAVFFSVLAQPIIEFYCLNTSFDAFANLVHEYGFYAMLLKPFLPFPFKLAVMVYGFTGYNFWLFLLATLVSRPLRFCFVSFLMVKFGMRYRDWLLKHVWLIKLLYVVFISGFMVFLAFKC